MDKPIDKKSISNVSEIIDFYVKDLGKTREEAIQIVGLNNKYPSKDNGFFTPQFKLLENGTRVQNGEKPNYTEYAHYIKDTYHTKSDDAYCYVWNGTHYDYATFTFLDNLCLRETKYKVTPPQLGNFKKHLMAASYTVADNLVTPIGKINMVNGVLDVKTKKLEPHNPNYFFRYCLKHKYDANAQCPNFMKFLNFVFGDSSILPALTLEIFGYCLLGGDPVTHKAFLLYGEGRNGKSTWLDTLRELLGYHNTAAVSMKLLGKPFSMVQLDGKLANIVEESPAEIDPEDFKNIVGGGMVTASHKGKPEYQLKVDSRLFFATNKLPRFNDASSGIRERLLILPFNRYISEQDRDTDIKNKLKKEIPGIINMVLHALDDFVDRKYKFPRLTELDKVLDEYIKESDSVHSWAFEFLEFTDSLNDFVVTNELFKKYVANCSEFHIRPVGINEFRRRIKKVYTTLYTSRGNLFNDSTDGRKTNEKNTLRGAKRIAYYVNANS